MAAIPASAEGLLRGLTFLTISWVTFTIGTVLVSLRTYVRSSNRAMGRDDYLILVALVRPSHRASKMNPNVIGVQLDYRIFWIDNKRVSSSEWTWKTHWFIDSGRAIWFREMDSHRRGTNRHRHRLYQSVSLLLHSTHLQAHQPEACIYNLRFGDTSHRHHYRSRHHISTTVQAIERAVWSKGCWNLLFSTCNIWSGVRPRWWVGADHCLRSSCSYYHSCQHIYWFLLCRTTVLRHTKASNEEKTQDRHISHYGLRGIVSPLCSSNGLPVLKRAVLHPARFSAQRSSILISRKMWHVGTLPAHL